MKSGTIAMSVVCAFHVLGLYYSWLIRTAAPGAEYYWLSSFSDDFFYYTQIARNIVEHGTSTFDGITRTNGYQPLWAVILFGLAHVFPVDQSPFFHVVFWVEIALCAIGTWFMRRLMREFNSDSVCIEMLTALYFVLSTRLAATGMEIGLVFALFPCFYKTALAAYSTVSPVNFLKLGVVSSILLLSRLDSAVIIGVMLLVTLLVLQRSDNWGKAFVSMSPFFVGLLPFVGYLVFNYATYGYIMPLSGVAKGLRDSFYPSALALRDLVTITPLHYLVFPTLPLLFICITVFIGAAELRSANRLDARSVLPFLCIASVPIFFIVASIRSDWMLWPWYFYPIILALPFAVMTMERVIVQMAVRTSFSIKTPNRFSVFLILFIVAPIVTVNTLHFYRWRRLGEHTQALKIAEFAKKHPGTYAMGDLAGLPGFLIGSVVQLEGLVADDKMIQHIANRTPLLDVLREYRVNYYVTVGAEQLPNGCWRVEEPDQPGPSAPRMLGELCQQPVTTFTTPFGPLGSDAMRWTAIFAIDDTAPNRRTEPGPG